MHLRISTTDGVAIYLQIVNQIKHLVASGRLAPGEEIPPIRALAAQLLVNPNTVARAYRELEAAGIIATRRGAGTVVRAAPSPLSRRERMRILAGRADDLLTDARHLDVDLEEIVDLVRERAGRIPDKRKS